MAAVTATRGADQVAVDLAATILAMYGHVGRTLSAQPPRIGAVKAQARSAFAAAAGQWSAMIAPVARDAVALVPTGRGHPDLSRAYAADLGDTLDRAAAAALDFGMDLQIARGQHPDVAWQRAVAGYGLDTAGMRGYLTGATRVDADGAMALLSAARKTAQQALLTRSQQIGDREAAAWSTLPAGTSAAVAKAFDPQEQRDDGGRWSTRPRAEVAETEQRAPDAVDALLGGPPGGAPDPNRYLTANRYAAAARDPNRYLTADRYTAAARDPDRYTRAARDPGRYTDPDRYTRTPARTPVVNRLYVLTATAKHMPQDTEPKPEPRPSAYGANMYLPVNNLDDHWFRRGRTNTQAIVNFEHIRAASVGTGGRGAHIEAIGAATPWDMIAPVPGVDRDTWSGVAAKALDMWHDIMLDPMDAVGALDTGDLAEIAERAGYPLLASKQTLLELFGDNAEMAAAHTEKKKDANGRLVRRFDLGLLESLADYAVWIEPEKISEQGKELGALLDQHVDRDALAQTPIPSIISFPQGLHPDEDTADMQGRYKVLETNYSSGIATWGAGLPPGRIGLREIELEPDTRM